RPGPIERGDPGDAARTRRPFRRRPGDAHEPSRDGRARISVVAAAAGIGDERPGGSAASRRAAVRGTATDAFPRRTAGVLAGQPAPPRKRLAGGTLVARGVGPARSGVGGVIP